jgi:hypothetical protein
MTMKMDISTERQQGFARALEDAPLDKRIEVAELIRAIYVKEVQETQRVLDPACLRDINEGIAMLKAMRH